MKYCVYGCQKNATIIMRLKSYFSVNKLGFTKYLICSVDQTETSYAGKWFYE